MNIIFVTNTYRPHVGGVARSIEAFSTALRERGHRVLVVAPEFPGMENGETDTIRIAAIQKFNASDFSVAIPLPRQLALTGLEFGAQLVHSHHPFLLGNTAIRLARSLQVPLVFTHHTLYEQYTHYVLRDSPKMAAFTVELATRYANLTDRVIAPSESIRNLIVGRGVSRPVDVIPTGVQVEKFQADGARFRRERGIDEGAYVVGHMGRLAPEKNIGYLAQAVADFLRHRPEAVFLLVGKGPSEKVVHSLFADNGVSDQLVYCGELVGDPLAASLNAMDVFAFTSHSETQGMVLTEAMAAGVPVVALDAGGVREVVTDGDNGRLLAADAGIDEFAAALSRVQGAGEQQRQKLIAGARRTAEEFSLRSSVDRLLACYEQLPDKSRASYGVDDPLGLEPLLERLKTEWEIFSNYAQSGGEAIRRPLPHADALANNPTIPVA